MYSMYIDDERFPKYEFDVIVRSFDQATSYMLIYGVPTYISFDHDLGENTPTGFDIAKWLVEMDQDNVCTMPETFSFNVHSANPVGAENIRCLLNNYLQVKYDQTFTQE